MKNLKEFFKITKLKVFIIFLVIFILTPVISIFFYPNYAGGTASGSAYWENKMTWGIYPFVFMGLQEETSYKCNFRFDENCKPTKSTKMTYTVYETITGGNSLCAILNGKGSVMTSSPMDLGIFKSGTYLNGTLISGGIQFVVDILINIIISYLLVCLIFFGYRKIYKKA